MMGLIKKDLFVVKGNFKRIFIIIVVFSLIALNGETSFAFMSTYMSVAMMISTFSYDEYNKTDGYIRTLPNGTRNSVLAKYATSLIICCACLALSVLVLFISSIYNSITASEILVASFGNLLGILLVQTVFYPIIYKFGIEKARVSLFVFAFLIVGISVLFQMMNIDLQIPANILNNFKRLEDILLPTIIIGLYIISYFLSKNFYSKKEF